ncbi:hypothetical protein NDU88_003113 [Pleurodeles waltl]|uniref:Uncharacterized protein n=1 Tax=Pleurodeles waltl TaxID=8319 RepID=A0AAV7UCG5_PLEWA|nr:hypothetical protein NDU88_003113 [Pleurodeles waltl]
MLTRLALRDDPLGTPQMSFLFVEVYCLRRDCWSLVGVEVVVNGCNFVAEEFKEVVAEVLGGGDAVGGGCWCSEVFDDHEDLFAAVGAAFYTLD